MPSPIGRKNLGKFFCSTRRRRRTGTVKPVWNCGRTLRQWYIWLMVFRYVKPGMPRGDLPPTWQVSGNADILRWCIMWGFGWRLLLFVQTAYSSAGAEIDSTPDALSSLTGLPLATGRTGRTTKPPLPTPLLSDTMWYFPPQVNALTSDFTGNCSVAIHAQYFQ